MITYFLGQEEVIAYARDLAKRLMALGDNFPLTWCPLGISGQKIAGVIADQLPPDVMENVKFVRIGSDRSTGEATYIDPVEGADLSKPVLVLDSAIHSGRTMLHAVGLISDAGAQEVITYSLVIKGGAELVPNYFGVLIADHDRAYFQLASIPNNRLKAKPPFGVLRVLTAEDISRPLPKTGLASMDSTKFSDLIYEQASRGTHVYVYEHAKAICGFVSFEHRDRKVFVDAVGADIAYHGRSVGGLLVRWAETWARSHKCEVVELWAIEERRPFYEHMGYEVDGQLLDLGDEQLRLMRKRMLYNVKPEIE